ncbi:MAG: hypothetical protein L0Y72_21055 [Gemmataceae bacterium]|nr:hypothetical protein [Gemmataceae bacterium]
MTLDELPTFIVSDLEGDRAVGSFSEPRWVGERHIACVVVEGKRFVWGRLAQVNMEGGTLAFVPDRVDDLRYFNCGRSYPRLDGYWGELAELVLDSSKRWKEHRFAPVDAVQFPIDGGRMLGKISGDIPADGTVVQGGWDHEHCEICWATISPVDDPIGMFSEPDQWVCCNCYQRFIVPQSLGFIVDGQ